MPYISKSVICFGFDICKGLYVHMNDQCNPVLSWDDEREERKTGNSSLSARGLRMSLPGYRRKETGIDEMKEKENRKEK